MWLSPNKCVEFSECKWYSMHKQYLTYTATRPLIMYLRMPVLNQSIKIQLLLQSLISSSHYIVMDDAVYCIAGNFRGRKLSWILRFFHHSQKFSPRNSRHATPIMRPILTFREMLLSYRSAKVFSLENFPLDGIGWKIGTVLSAP